MYSKLHSVKSAAVIHDEKLIKEMTVPFILHACGCLEKKSQSQLSNTVLQALAKSPAWVSLSVYDVFVAVCVLPNI